MTQTTVSERSHFDPKVNKTNYITIILDTTRTIINNKSNNKTITTTVRITIKITIILLYYNIDFVPGIPRLRIVLGVIVVCLVSGLVLFYFSVYLRIVVVFSFL